MVSLSALIAVMVPWPNMGCETTSPTANLLPVASLDEDEASSFCAITFFLGTAFGGEALFARGFVGFFIAGIALLRAKIVGDTIAVCDSDLSDGAGPENTGVSCYCDDGGELVCWEVRERTSENSRAAALLAFIRPIAFRIIRSEESANIRLQIFILRLSTLKRPVQARSDRKMVMYRSRHQITATAKPPIGRQPFPKKPKDAE
jgi:hypothetical protein